MSEERFAMTETLERSSSTAAGAPAPESRGPREQSSRVSTRCSRFAFYLTLEDVVAQANQRLGRPVVYPVLVKNGVDSGFLRGWVNEEGKFHFETPSFVAWTFRTRLAINDRILTYDQWADLLARRARLGPDRWFSE